MSVVNLCRVVFHGSGLGEEFSFGWDLANADLVSESEAYDYLGEVINQLTTGATPSAKTLMTQELLAGQSYDHISAYLYPTSGNLPATIASTRNFGSGWGGVGANALPLQVACCVTKLTGLSGPSNRGRCYLPVTGGGVGADGQFSDGYTDQQRNLAGLISGTVKTAHINHYGSSPELVVYSPKRDTTRVMTSLSVDSRPDIQRRRAASQRPRYTTSAIVP